MKNFYFLYRHVRLDTNEVFYIGVGTGVEKYNTEKSRCFRAFKNSGRNKHWQNIVAKTDYEVEILMESDNYEFIKQKEIEFIALYGRRDSNEGTLCNKTNGGDGGIGKIITEEIRENLRQGQLKSNKTRKKGKKLPDWWCERISSAVTGENNSMYGRTGKDHPNSKRVIDLDTLMVYDSIGEAATAIGLEMKDLSMNINRENNFSSCVFYETYISMGIDYCRTLCDKPKKMEALRPKRIKDLITNKVYNTKRELVDAIGMNISTFNYHFKNGKFPQYQIIIDGL